MADQYALLVVLSALWRESLLRVARAFVRTLGILDLSDWQAYARGELREHKGVPPEDIPACPNVTDHALGWRGYGDWLGTGNKSKRGRPRLPFPGARRLARSLGLAGVDEGKAWWRKARGESRERLDIPAKPYITYREEGGVDWANFLGTRHRKGKFREFHAAREWAHRLALKGTAEWFAFCRGEYRGMELPIDIPVNPAVSYQGHGWVSFADWLGPAWKTRDGPPPLAGDSVEPEPAAQRSQ